MIPPENSTDDSLATTQIFCKLALQASLIAIPAYLGIFMIAIPYDSDAGIKRGLVLATPVIEFIVATVIYSIGFLTPLPDLNQEGNLSRSRSKLARRKMQLILIGSVPFLLGALSGTMLLLKAHL